MMKNIWEFLEIDVISKFVEYKKSKKNKNNL